MDRYRQHIPVFFILILFLIYSPGIAFSATAEGDAVSPSPVSNIWSLVQILLSLIIIFMLISLLLVGTKWLIYSGILSHHHTSSGQVRGRTERRKAARSKKSLPVVIKKQARRGIVIESHLKSRDISLSGIFVLTEDLSLYQIDEILDLKIFLGTNKEILTRARVVRSEIAYLRNGKEKMNGYGLLFLDMEEGESRILEAALTGKSGR